MRDVEGHHPQDVDLFVLEDAPTVEELSAASAPAGCFFCGTSASTASCPGSTAATVGCASTLS